MSPPTDQNQHGAAHRLRLVIQRAYTGVRIDVARLHRLWMALGFPRDLREEHSVVEQWQPDSASGRFRFRVWAILGGIGLVVVYPLFVVGLATRFYARRLNRVTASLGLVGVAVLSVLGWGLFTVGTYLSPITFEGVIAVAIAGVVASVSAVCAVVCTRFSGRGITVAFGYPFGVTAIFLPPVVASLYSTLLASMIFPRSETIAIWLLDNVLHYGGLAAMIRASFELDGFGHVGMWFGLAFPVGWVLGVLVTFTYLVPSLDAVEGRGESRPESIYD